MRIETFSETASFLPQSLFIVQDGGYFYIFRDEEHANTDEEQPLRFVDSGHNPEFGDFPAAERARMAILDWLDDRDITFG